jgi:Mg/Co/Ni transporter MgtE
MSIVIDTDMTLVMQRLHISEAKMKDVYANKSLEEIVEKEAEEGNQAAVAFAHELFTTPRMLVKIFQLADPQNKITFLKEMNSSQLHELLPKLEEDDLNQGLNFFDMNKLMDMLEKLPPEQLVKTVFQLFSEEEIMKYLPEEQLDKFLENPDVDKYQIMNNLALIPQEYLAQMYEAVSGEDCEKMGSKELMQKIGELNPLQFMDAVQAMQPAAKQKVTLGIAHSRQELYQNFDPHAYTNMIKTYKYQPDVVKGMEVLEPEEKMKMLKQLPDDFLAIVITQMDAKVFAEQLINKHPKLLAQAIMQ